MSDMLFFTGISFCLIGIVLCGIGAWMLIGQQ